MKRIRVELLHVGLHKCASTYLQRHVFTSENGFRLLRDRMHRGLFRKLQNGCITYERGAFVDAFNKSIRQDERLRVVVSHEQLSGHATSSINMRFLTNELPYLFDTNCVLVVLRNPLDYMYSIWSHYVRRGGYLSFRRFLYHHSAPTRQKRHDLLFHRLDYVRYIDALEEAFGAEKVAVLLYEDLRDDPASFFEKLSQAAGFHIQRPASTARPHASMTHFGNNFCRLVNVFFDTKYTGTPFSKLPSFPRWRNTMERVFRKQGSQTEFMRQHVLNALRREDGASLQQGMARLEARLGRDLTVLGYPVS